MILIQLYWKLEESSANKGNTADRYAPADFFVMYRKRKNRTFLVILFLVLLSAPLIYWDYCRIVGFPEPLIKWDQVFRKEYPSTHFSILIVIYIVLAFVFWGIYKKKKFWLFFVILFYGFMLLTLIVGVVSSLKDVLN